MAELDQRIEQLQARIDNLVKYQEYFYREISQLNQEINLLKSARQPAVQPKPVEPAQPQPMAETTPPHTAQFQEVPRQKPVQPRPQPAQPPHQQQRAAQPSIYAVSGSTALEKFVGQNILSIVGILVLIIGVGIGAKYAIDNNLISPAMRISIGYVAGLALLGVALYLKKKYLNFSAVLMSGAMAVMYFITFFAYSLYDLIPQTLAFVLMLILTGVTVFWALSYGKQVIAHIGLVGAYAIPFMLGGNSGNYAFLFTYIAIINFGILIVSVRRYWKWLFYNAFGFTWLIYFAWYVTAFQSDVHFQLAFLFATIFFLTFYVTFIIHKLVFHENIAAENGGLIVSNSFIFYGFGYALLSRRGLGEYHGLFTIGNAMLHFLFATAASRLAKVPRDIPVLMTALVIVFITLAIPIQLDGNWLTLAWTMQAVILFWLGRTRTIELYEYFSYPVLFLAGIAFVFDLGRGSTLTLEMLAGQMLFVNWLFVTSIIFAGALAVIYFINRDERYQPAVTEDVRAVFGYFLVAAATVVFYNAFRTEIANYFSYQYLAAKSVGIYSSRYDEIKIFSFLWQLNYTMAFLALLSWLNIQKLKNTVVAVVNLAFNTFALTLFFTVGTFLLTVFHQRYFSPTDPEIFTVGVEYIWIRYVCYVFAATLVVASYRYTKMPNLRELKEAVKLPRIFDVVLSLILLIVFSAELMNWMGVDAGQGSTKLGLSILWGVFALVLMIVGIYRRKIHLRISAISLFGLTLVKLFFYDIADLSTISKTIVFVTLGILLLIMSFLYNKYKTIIFGPDEVNEKKTD